MSKFKVGDKVKCTYSRGETNFIPGHIYKVVTDTLNHPAIASEANGQLISMAVMCDLYHWYDFERVALPVTVITTDGTTTTATLREGKRTIRTASAKCDPRDTFDYETGAKLAFNRLFTEVTEAAPEPPKPKYYTGKMVCIKSGYPWWTVGKVYGIVDGTITADNGGKYRGYISAEDARHAGNSFDEAPFPGSDACHNHNNEFIPFVEG